jgi:hypothetical protein
MRLAPFAVLTLILTSCTTLTEPAPYRTRIQSPSQLVAIQPLPRAAKVLPTGDIRAGIQFNWSNIWGPEDEGTQSAVWDGEIVRTNFSFQVGIGEDLDLEIGLPLMYAGGGTLDSFIENWHDWFYLPNAGRDDHPQDRFDMRATNGDEDGYVMDRHGLYVGDIPIFLSWFPLEQSDDMPTSLGVRGGIELPTGDDDDGYGSGGIDASIGFLGQIDEEKCSIFYWGNAALVNQWDRADDADIDIDWVPSFGAGFELGVADGLSGLAQLSWEKSVLRDLDTRRTNRNQLVVSFGGRYWISENLRFDFALIEDLIQKISPDVTIHLALQVAF